jgi:DNA-directed RNA polymerase specialized sigma24 family protein
MDALHDDLRGAWQRFVDELAPLRPALHAYCRRLTGNVWDAEVSCRTRCCAPSGSGA